MNFSCGESTTPSADSTGIQLPASTEYSPRRNGEAASAASNSISTTAADFLGVPGVTTGGVLSIKTGELTSSVSRAEAGGLASRSEASTRKKYLPSANASPSAAKVFSCRRSEERRVGKECR